jgi:hypothetical protein
MKDIHTNKIPVVGYRTRKSIWRRGDHVDQMSKRLDPLSRGKLKKPETVGNRSAVQKLKDLGERAWGRWTK